MKIFLAAMMVCLGHVADAVRKEPAFRPDTGKGGLHLGPDFALVQEKEVAEAEAIVSSSTNRSRRSGTFPPRNWDCNWKRRHQRRWDTYCAIQNSVKSFAVSHDCRRARYATKTKGGGATGKAVAFCKSASKFQTCYTVDSGGRGCFEDVRGRTCDAQSKERFHERKWKQYCSSRSTTKAWYQTRDCSAHGYSLSSRDEAKELCEAKGKGTCFLWDDGGQFAPPNCLPACMQRYELWCWATVVAALASYWDPEKFPATGKDTCMGVSCQVARFARGDKCCRMADEHHDFEWSHSCGKTGNGREMLNGLKHLVGDKGYVGRGGKLAKGKLWKTLRTKGPVVLGIFWRQSRDVDGNAAGHVILVGGAASYNDFWVHNTAGDYQGYQQGHQQGAGHWEALGYQQLVDYQGRGDWNYTMFIPA